MIYDYPGEDRPIRQGDIFLGLPRIDISLQQIIQVCDAGIASPKPWESLLDSPDSIEAVLPITKVAAIVISQDCDNLRAEDISFCEIEEFSSIEGKAASAKDAKGFTSIITQHARVNLKWFYLPVDDRIPFSKKMAVDFQSVFRLSRPDLQALLKMRKATLNSLAREHFRERLSEFFRRYAYDEWYPLDRAELEHYRSKYPDAQPFPWQNFSSPDAAQAGA
jgi:hypothetical protein